MKIPFEDRRTNMNRRWTDIRKIKKFRFNELIDQIEDCNELGKEEFLKLKEMVERKLNAYSIEYPAHGGISKIVLNLITRKLKDK